VPVQNAFGGRQMNSFRGSSSKVVMTENGHNVSFDKGEKNSSFISRRDIDRNGKNYKNQSLIPKGMETELRPISSYVLFNKLLIN
jgi:hypothetical protein